MSMYQVATQVMASMGPTHVVVSPHINVKLMVQCILNYQKMTTYFACHRYSSI